MKILITYAGTTGTAAGVAERVARVMTGLGAEVTVSPMSGVVTVKGYSAVVAGCLEQGGRWVPEAMEFVRNNQSALNERILRFSLLFPRLPRRRVLSRVSL